MADSADVRCVILSDLHLGEADSILTRSGEGRSGDLLRALIRCTEHAVGDARPVLVLNGDALELAFGSFDQALANFERLVEIVLQRDRFERIVYLPGNHDHHIWEIARETQYADALVHRRKGDRIPPLRHVTSCRLEDAVPAYVLNKILEQVRRGRDTRLAGSVDVVYPNLLLSDPTGRRGVLIHHGHYVEPLYHFFSTIRRWLFPDRPDPATLEEVEEENFAWIDFVWSLLGRSGGAGADMQALFRMLRNPGEFEVFADALARRTAVVARVRWLPARYLRRLVLKRLFRWAGPIVAGERTRLGPAYPTRLRHGIEGYLFGPALRQVEDVAGRVPDELSFIFGHTHKPFEAVLPAPRGGPPVALYNTGGWPVDSLEPRPPMGAGIVFVSEALEVAALRIYNDGADGGAVTLDVRAAEGAAGEAFRDTVRRRVDHPEGPWAAFAAGIRDAIRVRRGEQSTLRESLTTSLAEIRAIAP